MKKIIVAGVVVLCLLGGWAVTMLTLLRPDDTQAKIAQYQQLAQEQAARGGYGLAADCYSKIIALQDSPEARLAKAEMYREAGLTNTYKATLEEMIAVYPKDSRGYEALAGYYDSVDAHSDCVEVVRQAYQAEAGSDTLQQLYYAHAFEYYAMRGSYDSVTPMLHGCAAVSDGDRMGLVDSTGYIIGNTLYDMVTPYNGDLAAARDGERCGFLKADGTWYVVLEEPFEEAYPFHDGLGVIVRNGQALFVDRIGAVRLGPYEDATGFAGGVAAVKTNGSWQLINTSGEAVCADLYEDVLRDTDGLCSTAGVIFVKSAGQWRLVNTKGEACSELTFDEARPFYSDTEPAAVCVDGKWGFVNMEGAWSAEPQWEGADSYSAGLAAVQVDGAWGYMDHNLRVVIEPQFDAAGPFSSYKTAPVESGGAWYFIKLLV